MPQLDNKKYICYQCNQTLPTNQFYKTNSQLYDGTGYLPVCKDCLNAIFHKYINIYGDSRKALRRICMAFDLYYNDAIFDTCNCDTSVILGTYIKRLNVVQYKNRTFDTTLEEGFDFNKLSSLKKKKNGEEKEDVDPKDIEKWGIGFEKIDYDVLNSHYKLLINANPNRDSNQEIFINDLCYIKMQQMKAVREGKVDDYNKLTDSYRKSFQQAGLKTVKDANNGEEFVIGVNGEMIEKYTPAEYYKNKKLYYDHDNIGEYIDRFMLRPLRNLMYGTKDRDREYYVKDEVSENAYSDDE